MSRLNRETRVLGLMALLAGLVAATVSFAQSKQAQPAPNKDTESTAKAASARELPKPILDTHHLMELFNEQVYIYMQEAMKEQPSDSEGWNTIAERGLQAAEVMNLVAIRKSANEHENWKQLTSETQQAALDLTAAAQTKNFDKTQAAYRGLIQSCNNCHQKIAPDEAPKLQP